VTFYSATFSPRVPFGYGTTTVEAQRGKKNARRFGNRRAVMSLPRDEDLPFVRIKIGDELAQRNVIIFHSKRNRNCWCNLLTRQSFLTIGFSSENCQMLDEDVLDCFFFFDLY
jgi:hypothetical protein